MSVDGKRIPELPSYLAYTTTLANDDKFPYYLAEFDKTVWMNVSTFRTWILSGGSGSITPVVIGNKMIYDTTDADVGGTIVSIPSLAGKMFNLELEGRPLKTTEYSILSGGGFNITIPGIKLRKNQRFTLELYEFAITGGQQPATPGAATGFITGTKEVTASYSFSAQNDVGLIMQLRGGNSSLVFTLPAVDEIPENTVIIIEAMAGNQKQHEVTTKEGQYIYINNSQDTSIHIGPAEVVWLYRGSEGWYIINDFGNIYKNLCIPFPSFDATVQHDEVLLNGTEYDRADIPRAWKKIQTLGGALVTETQWQTSELTDANGYKHPYPYRGKFSSGTTGSKVRLPNLCGSTLRGLLPGGDSNRTDNNAGNFQKAAINMQGLEIVTKIRSGSGGSSTNPLNAPESGFSGMDGFGSWITDTSKKWLDISLSGGEAGKESRMDNIGIYWKMKI